MSTKRADNTFIGIGLMVIATVGTICFMNGGWLGLGLFAVVVALIFGLAG